MYRMLIYRLVIPVVLAGAVACKSSTKVSVSVNMDVKKGGGGGGKVKGANKAVVKEAEKYLGVKYKFGGTDRRGMDCSGLTYTCFKDVAGIELPRTSYDQAGVGKNVKKSDAAPGDLIFFKGSDIKSAKIGHVGIVVENTGSEIKFIHSASTGVRYDYLERNSYYKPRFVMVKRLD